MEKLCLISNRDEKALEGVSPDYLDTLWRGISREQRLDVYSDDEGKLFTSLIMPNESMCFIPMVRLKHNIFYEKIDLYIQSPNYPEQGVNKISIPYDEIIDEILNTAPTTNELYRIWVKDCDYGILELEGSIESEHGLGVICNASFSKEDLAGKTTYPLHCKASEPHTVYGFLYKKAGNIWF